MIDQWGIPVRIISQPSGGWWTIPEVTLPIGVILGLLAAPVKELVKEHVIERSRRRRANRELYDELGAYLARFAAFKLREEARIKPSAERFDIELWQELTRPYMPHFDYFSGREQQSIFLRMDNPRGIHYLVQWLRFVGSTYRPPDAMPYAHPDPNQFRAFCSDVVSGYTHFLNSKDSSRRRITRVFNRQREDKSIPFPIPAGQTARHKSRHVRRSL